MGSNSISQITINSYDNVQNLFENVFDSLSSNNIQLQKQSLDDEEGNILAEIYTHKTDTYKLVITKTYISNSSNLSVDYVNLIGL
ncbi:hypothetical protein OFR29_11205 [Brachyspira hyodysenteriae]|nr:hypothetical protein [Brachyspira hyodysenteriae]MCZ9892843.1 hypothetical protein [Brachyspira hyodysenteriae]MCZ9990392.1 hypothetical protein [Brachyspira hyodysenteriae]MCZ9998759.1 hypothetical protein [Brachyspira hyodysenteriae]MCZ9999941.1 hypothetical protein [Brachyspira hyodysenteriae]MDA0007195.1 hypothetical protein [Brachyspira hyodysenteriae]